MYVLSIVAKGYRLSFKSPPLRQTPWEIRSPQGPEEILGMREQITLMLQKNAITEVPPNSPGFYSHVFLVRKASGGWCPVIDLKNLNAHIHAPHFRMFTTNSVLSSVRKGDYAFKIDLQDAYFQVPIHLSSRKYLRFAFDLEEASLPQSKAWEIVARARHLSSLRVQTYSQVSWGHSIGPQVLSLWVVSGGPHNFYGRLHAGVGRSHGGFPDFRYLDLYRPQAPYQLSGAQGGNLCPTALGSSAPGPPGYDRHRQFDSSFIYQKQGGTRSPTLLRLTVDLFLWLEAQNIIVWARHIPGCLNVIADHLSRPNQSISTEWSLHPEVVKRIFRLWETPEVNMFATVSNSHLTRFMSPMSEPRALAVDALSQDWQGRSMYMFPPFPLLNKVIQKLRSTQAAEVVLIAPWWQSQSWFPHLLRLCVEHPLAFPYRQDLLSQQDQKYVSDGKSYHLHAWRLSYDTIKQQAFQTRSLGSRQPLGGPQPIACTTIGGFASLDGLQGKGLIRLIPQLLK